MSTSMSLFKPKLVFLVYMLEVTLYKLAVTGDIK